MDSREVVNDALSVFWLQKVYRANNLHSSSSEELHLVIVELEGSRLEILRTGFVDCTRQECGAAPDLAETLGCACWWVSLSLTCEFDWLATNSVHSL